MQGYDVQTSPQTFTIQQRGAFARYLLASRRRRNASFPTVEFAEPAWDMMLELYASYAEGRQVSIYILCGASAVPPTTAFRWINVMVEAGHFVRTPDTVDRRRVFISLSTDSMESLEQYLDTELRMIFDI